jgi:hypothetical protein
LQTLCAYGAARLRALCNRPRPWRQIRLRSLARGSRWDMDLIAVAIVVALGAVGLAWIVFADRI